ncbi:hypothetical protein [Actinophytocola sp. KF-1]
MRDTDRREDLAAQPLPEQREPAPETEPIPVDEAGLERGGRNMDDGRVHDGRMTDGVGMDDGRDTDMVPPQRDVMPGDMAQEGAPPMDAMPVPAASAQTPGQASEHDLFGGDTAERLRTRWRELQADFVDDPQRAVREADEVVDEVVRTITDHRARLAGEWQGHTDTEHLRLALREYRSFIDRLLPS